MIFFITLFRYFTIVLFFTLHFFSFSQGMQTRERAHCARSVFPFIKKKKKKKEGARDGTCERLRLDNKLRDVRKAGNPSHKGDKGR